MNNKIIYVNYLRSISMLCIVLYHCLCYYTNRWDYISPRIQIYDSIAGMIHCITLPMFVFISGYLYCIFRDKGKYSDYTSFLKRKASRLLLPMIIWSIFCVIAIPNASWSDLKGGSYKHLWFLGMLFVLFVIAPYLRKIVLKSKQGFLWILLFCVCSYLFHKRPLVCILPSPFLDAGCYVFAFFAGIWKGHNINSNICKISNSALFLVSGVYGITYITPPV